MKKNWIEHLLPVIASLAIVFLVGIIFALFAEGLPTFGEVNFFRFITGTEWRPTRAEPELGILTLIVASAGVTGLALLIAIPVSLGGAVFVAEWCSPRLKEVLKPFIELLASIPSVVYGFFGMVMLAPFIQDLFNLPTGMCMFTAGIILGIMVVPTITSIAEDALTSVPRDLRHASLALGATKWETTTRVVVPAASSGIVTGVILGMGRAIGETMTVLMVAGGAIQMPGSLFDPVRPMTATIAAEMGETSVGGIHYHALFGIALVLFIITLALNLFAEWLSGRRKHEKG